jgi:hypothetical protein
MAPTRSVSSAVLTSQSKEIEKFSFIFSIVFFGLTLSYLFSSVQKADKRAITLSASANDTTSEGVCIYRQGMLINPVRMPVPATCISRASVPVGLAIASV